MGRHGCGGTLAEELGISTRSSRGEDSGNNSRRNQKQCFAFLNTPMPEEQEGTTDDPAPGQNWQWLHELMRITIPAAQHEVFQHLFWRLNSCHLRQICVPTLKCRPWCMCDARCGKPKRKNQARIDECRIAKARLSQGGFAREAGQLKSRRLAAAPRATSTFRDGLPCTVLRSTHWTSPSLTHAGAHVPWHQARFTAAQPHSSSTRTA
mmetsp:Transcript_13753/g.35381  ORF Transcript_13753/g.35381 Transcript_13753/m.35381 type:complete len:208 (+) Transcript_13753:109-732(+)